MRKSKRSYWEIGPNSLWICALSFAGIAYVCNHVSSVFLAGFGIIFFLSIGMLIYSWVKSRLTLRELAKLIFHYNDILIDFSIILDLAILFTAGILSEPVKMAISYVSLAVAIVAAILALWWGRRNH
jgi:hypothetical protein